MNIILVLIPVTLLIVIAAVGVFFWAAHHQQFDDLDSPAVLPLMEEREASAPPSAADETAPD
jgi:cbb3-type cytochrome oxidase maturation protein